MDQSRSLDYYDHPLKVIVIANRVASFLDLGDLIRLGKVSMVCHDAVTNYSSDSWERLTTQALINRAGVVGNVMIIKNAVINRRSSFTFLEALKSLYSLNLVRGILSIFDAGLDVNTEDDGIPMLKFATFKKDHNLVKALVDRGAHNSR